jgi:hypothetical protein
MIMLITKDSQSFLELDYFFVISRNKGVGNK